MRERVTGCVLAGGRSSRMGRDKALLELGGRPLIARAVETVRETCGRCCIVGNRLELSAFAEVIADRREGCGPLAGLEAAQRSATTEWVLLMAVDMPFVPAGLLRWLIEGAGQRPGVRVAMFVSEGVRQPALSLVHREVAPFAVEALDRSSLKLFPVLRDAAGELARRSGLKPEEALWMPDGQDAEIRTFVTESEWQGRARWFENLNTAEEYRAACEPGQADAGPSRRMQQ